MPRRTRDVSWESTGGMHRCRLLLPGEAILFLCSSSVLCVVCFWSSRSSPSAIQSCFSALSASTYPSRSPAASNLIHAVVNLLRSKPFRQARHACNDETGLKSHSVAESEVIASELKPVGSVVRLSCTDFVMSADSGVLFPQLDAPVIADLGHLPEYEDLAKHLLWGSAIESFPGSELLLGLEGRNNVPMLSLGEFDYFSTFGMIAEEGKEEEDEKDVEIESCSVLFSSQGKDEGHSAMSSWAASMGIQTLRSSICKLAYGGLCDGDTDENLSVSMDTEPANQMSSVCEKEVQLPSPKSTIAIAKLESLNLNDLAAAGPVKSISPDPEELNDDRFSMGVPTLQGSPLAINIATRSIVSTSFSSTSPVTLVSPSESLTARVPGTQGFVSSRSFIANALSAENGSSPVSSLSTLTSSDGSCTVGTETSSLSVHHLVNGDVIEEDNINSAQRSSPDRQEAGVAPLADCTSAIGGHSPCLDVFGNGHGAIPPHVVEEVSQFPSIQRSHSSHALGQLMSPMHPRAFHDDFRISTKSKHEASGLSNLGEFNKAHLTGSKDMNVRPSITSIRRVYSTGDLQGLNGEQIYYGGSSLFPVELSNAEEGCMRIGCYTLEERRMKLHRYRQKRTERNFNKKIKYVCRKTLADSRLRIRGRFARSDNIAESGYKPNKMHRDKDEEEYSWITSNRKTY